MGLLSQAKCCYKKRSVTGTTSHDMLHCKKCCQKNDINMVVLLVQFLLLERLVDHTLMTLVLTA